MKQQDKRILAGVGCLALFGVLFVCVAAMWYWHETGSRQGQHALPDPGAKARLFLHNDSSGDAGRSLIFREALTRGGQRCDSVERQIMQRPGVWLISCAPGYRYRFTFGPGGELERSERLP